MQLSEEQIKQAILHPYPPVRELALEYFSQSFCQDDTVMPFVIEAMKNLDEREIFRFANETTELPQTKSTIQWCMEELNQDLSEHVKTSPYLHYTIPLSRMLINAEPSLIRDRQSEILELPALHPEAVHDFSERISLLSESPESLWNMLMDFCERENEKEHISQMDTPHAHRLVEALARGGTDVAEKVLEMLNEEIDFSLENPRELMQGFVIRLAGELRLTSAVPFLFKMLKGNYYWHSEVSARALAQIGGRDVLEFVTKEYPTAKRPFKLSSIDILEKLRTENCVEKLLELFNQEKDGEFKTFLGRAILSHFPSEAVEPIRQYILESGNLEGDKFDPEIGDLRETLIAVCTLLEVDFPEFADWKKESDEDHLRYEENTTALDTDLSSLLSTLSEIDKGESLSDEDSVFQGEYDFQIDDDYIEPPGTIFRQDAKIGRNDPCPCDSGKKYKKCCMNKTSETPMFD